MSTNITPSQAEIASTAEAEAGTASDKFMTPERTKEAVSALAPLGKSYVSAEQTITTGGLKTLTHGLGVVPKLIQYTLVCKIAEHNYSIGDVVMAYANNSTAGSSRHSNATVTSSSILVRYSNSANVFTLPDANTGGSSSLTNNNWRLVVSAWA